VKPQKTEGKNGRRAGPCHQAVGEMEATLTEAKGNRIVLALQKRNHLNVGVCYEIVLLTY